MTAASHNRATVGNRTRVLCKWRSDMLTAYHRRLTDPSFSEEVRAECAKQYVVCPSVFAQRLPALHDGRISGGQCGSSQPLDCALIRRTSPKWRMIPRFATTDASAARACTTSARMSASAQLALALARIEAHYFFNKGGAVRLLRADALCLIQAGAVR